MWCTAWASFGWVVFLATAMAGYYMPALHQESQAIGPREGGEGGREMSATLTVTITQRPDGITSTELGITGADATELEIAIAEKFHDLLDDYMAKIERRAQIRMEMEGK
jgi:hypothetical protein